MSRCGSGKWGSGWWWLATVIWLVAGGCAKREPQVASPQGGPTASQREERKCGLICHLQERRERAKDPLQEETLGDRSAREDKPPRSKTGLLDRLRNRSAKEESPSYPDTTTGVYHIVKKGETLWRICQTYNVSVESVCRVNSITDPSSLSVGQRLWIPGVTRVLEVPPPTASISSTDYNSSRGESLPSSSGIHRGTLLFPVPGGEISSGFGASRRGHLHEGVDIIAPLGSPILAADDGKVVYSDDKIRGYGKMIIIKHAGNLVTVYAHNSKNLVRVGDLVKRGDKIGEVGQTGNATCPHLHFEVRVGEKPVDPQLYLP